MKSFLAAVPVALAIFLLGGWLFTRSAMEPAHAPQPFWQVTFILLSAAITTTGAVLGWRFRPKPVAYPLNSARFDAALICLFAATPFLVYNQFRIATTGHLTLPTKHGSDPHYFLTSTPISFTVLFIASASILGFLTFLLAAGLRALRHGR